MTDTTAQLVLKPIEKSLSLIPVSLREASYDSPTYRASVIYFSDQVVIIEKWLDTYTKSITRLISDATTMEDNYNTFLTKSVPPASVSEAVIDHDYTLLATRRFGESSKEWWLQIVSSVKKMESHILEPIKTFMSKDLRTFKDARRHLEQSQKTFDQALSRYVGQSKTKAPSSLREDAFQVHETRKAYLKASLDFCTLVTQFRYSIDRLLIRISFDQWREMKRSCESTVSSFTKIGGEMDRIRGWSKEVEAGEPIFRRELLFARREIAELASENSKPSREIEDYNLSTVAFLGSRSSTGNDKQAVWKEDKSSEKQGWLFVRTISGKPARTSWVRRWFYVKDGVFGWLHSSQSGGVDESGRIGVLLCSVKPAVQEDRRFCFEVMTKNQSVLVQAETQNQLMMWLEAFESAKKKSLSTSDDNSSALQGSLDFGFSSTTPLSSDSIKKSSDGQVAYFNDEQATITGSETTNSRGASIDAIAQRLSFNSKEDCETTGRDHATRIIQRLDPTRKPITSSPEQSSLPSSVSSGGIASLISASHNIIPLAINQNGSNTPPKAPVLQFETYSSTLAPATLAIPPVPTSLSKKAVLINGDRVSGTGFDASVSMPYVIMANFWGSSSWGYIDRLEKGEIRSNISLNKRIPNSSAKAQTIQNTRIGENCKTDVKIEDNFEQNLGFTTGTALSRNSQVSMLVGDKEITKTQNTPPTTPEITSTIYPPELKIQDSQFRILFPDVPKEDKVLLVFRAIWNPNEQQEFPGRVYVTQHEIYFYSHHLGLVIITGVSMTNISEVTTAPGKDCDFIFLHIREGLSQNSSRITVKTFLEPLRLLQARLNYLIDNSQANESVGFENTIATLIRMENEKNSSRSPSLESWEDFSLNTPVDDRAHDGHNNQNFTNSLYAKGSLYPGKSKKEMGRLHLPSQPVFYEPSEVYHKVIERQLNVSTKALFHAIFGDKSKVFQLLYHQRGAEKVAQGPWLSLEQDRLRRDFEYQINHSDNFFQSRKITLVDNQIVEIKNDHLCYVTSYYMSLWHLPCCTDFKIVFKIVITHTAKSKCKLAIYTKVDWSRIPSLISSLVEQHAFSDSGFLAERLADRILEHVRKLGPHSRTKKSINVFGHVGQQTSVLVSIPSPENVNKFLIKRRTLTNMLLGSVISFCGCTITSVIIFTFSVLKSTRNLISAHQFLLIALFLSLFTNLFFTSRDTSHWWAERKAANFMNKLGVGPNQVVSKAIYLKDLDEALTSLPIENLGQSESKCYDRFRWITNTTDLNLLNQLTGNVLLDASTKLTLRRISKTRQQLGSYRHDILVALRLVNQIEREVLRAEWEKWLLDENLICKQVSLMLQENNMDFSQGKGSKILADFPKWTSGGELQKSETIEALRRWIDAYCESCRREQALLA